MIVRQGSDLGQEVDCCELVDRPLRELPDLQAQLRECSNRLLVLGLVGRLGLLELIFQILKKCFTQLVTDIFVLTLCF